MLFFDCGVHYKKQEFSQSYTTAMNPVLMRWVQAPSLECRNVKNDCTEID